MATEDDYTDTARLPRRMETPNPHSYQTPQAAGLPFGSDNTHIVPAADAFGQQANFDPARPAGIRCVIDPDKNGDTFSFSSDMFSPENMQRVAGMVAPGASPIQIAMAMAKLAAQTATQPATPQPVPQLPQMQIPPAYNQPPQPNYSQMQPIVPPGSLQQNMPPQAYYPPTGQAPPTWHDMSRQVPVDAPVPAPRHWVTISVEGYGEVRVPFHAVIRSGTLLVLAYDTRYIGPQYEPTKSEAEVAVLLEEEKMLYGAIVPGLNFTYNNTKFHLLFITREAPYREQDG